MRSLKTLLAVALLSGAVTASPALAVPAGAPDRALPNTSPPQGEVVVRLDVGPGLNQIGIAEGPEEEVAWGPASFDIAEDGSFFVVDGVNSKVVVCDETGEFRRAIPFRSPVVGAVDIDVVRGSIFVLDLPAQPPSVHELDADGAVVRTWAVPPEYESIGITGLRASLAGSGPHVFLQTASGWEVQLVKAGRALPPVRIPARVLGSHIEIPASSRARFAAGCPSSNRRFTVDMDWDTRADASITGFDGDVPVSRAAVKSHARLGAVRFEGCDARGNVYVFAEQYDEGSKGWTSAHLKSYGPAGGPLACAELPLQALHVFPERFVRVAEDGSVFLLAPLADRVEVRRIRLVPDAADTLPTGAEAPVPGGSETQSDAEGAERTRLAEAVERLIRLLAPEKAYAIWTRLDANDRAWEYVGKSWYCSSANYSRSCGDYRPSYITSSGRTYTGVPYCWGGFDTPSGFVTDMADGLDAGDTNTTGGKRWCTSGVDCSGFVSRCWGLGTKQNTYTLRDFAYAVSKSSMLLADAYIRPGCHTMLFRYYTSGGAQVFEATTTNDYDRVVTRAWTATELSDYGAYRYHNW